MEAGGDGAPRSDPDEIISMDNISRVATVVPVSQAITN